MMQSVELQVSISKLRLMVLRNTHMMCTSMSTIMSMNKSMDIIMNMVTDTMTTTTMDITTTEPVRFLRSLKQLQKSLIIFLQTTLRL